MRIVSKKKHIEKISAECLCLKKKIAQNKCFQNNKYKTSQVISPEDSEEFKALTKKIMIQQDALSIEIEKLKALEIFLLRMKRRQII